MKSKVLTVARDLKSPDDKGTVWYCILKKPFRLSTDGIWCNDYDAYEPGMFEKMTGLKLKPGKKVKVRLEESEKGKIVIRHFGNYRLGKMGFCENEFEKATGLNFEGTKKFKVVKCG